MVTVEDIRNEVAGSFVIRTQMNLMIKKLKKFEERIGSGPIQDIIAGNRKLTLAEFKQVSTKFGVGGIAAIQALEGLNIAQKEYIFERMGWEWKPESPVKPIEVLPRATSQEPISEHPSTQ